MKNILIIGAGFAGSVIARILADKNYDITMIDKRDHIAGNCYDYTNQYGIRIHKYGPHLFHTNNTKIFNWLSKFTKWVEYKHKVKALLPDGKFVTMPVNKETTRIVGKDNIIETLFRPYSEKMWGMKLEMLDNDILKRVPIREDDNDLYFPNDKHQVMPRDGYTNLFQNLLDNKNIHIQLKKEYSKSMNEKFDFIFNSMPIDEYFDYIYGELPYRSIKFHNFDIPIPRALPTTTVNFTNHGPFTRVTEWKNIPCHGVNETYTSLTIEEPCDYKENKYERYYPVKDKNGKNRSIFNKYKKIIPQNMLFIGRCGQYVYLDMHQAVSSSLAISKKFLKEVG